MFFKLSFASCSLDFKLEFDCMGNWEKKDLVELRGPTAPGNFAQAKSSPAVTKRVLSALPCRRRRLVQDHEYVTSNAKYREHLIVCDEKINLTNK